MLGWINLMADEPGTYEGHNVEFSGEGYDTMHFKVVAKTMQGFEDWLSEAGNKANPLDLAAYEKLSEPNSDYPITVFSPVEPGIFNHVMDR